jgi:hypothetical protein
MAGGIGTDEVKQRVGSVNIEELLARSSDPMAKRLVSSAEESSRLIREKYMSPPGELRLDTWLEEQRWRYGIPDIAFRKQALFDAVYVWQIDLFEGNQTEGGIVIPEVCVDGAREAQPEGVLISAGLKATDALDDNGTILGDVVTLMRLSPYRIPVGHIHGCEYFVLAVKTGDLVGNRSLAERLKSGVVARSKGSDGKTNVYRFVHESVECMKE